MSTVLHIDRKTNEQLALEDDGTLSWTRKGEPVAFTAAAHGQRSSFHYPNRVLFAVEDLRSFVAGATEISEREMQWTAGDSQALYREIVRFGDRVLIVWGRNNARDLQSVGVIAGESEARALVKAFRAAPLKGFKSTSPYFIEGRGGVVREYWPVPESGTHGKVEKGRGRCLDNRVSWTTQYPKYERDELLEELATDEAAEQRFDALELDWYKRGGSPYEIEWMKTARRRSQHTIYEWFQQTGKASPRPVATKLLADANLETAALPAEYDAVVRVLYQTPAAHWVRVGETVGKLVRKVGPKPNIELLLDTALHVVATVTRDPKTGDVRTVGVKRAKSADAAKALFDK